MKHISPQLNESNGVSVYGDYIDRLMDWSKYTSNPCLHFELGYTGVFEFWQANQARRARKPYLLTLHDPPIVIGRPFEQFLPSRNPVIKTLRKLLDLTLGRFIVARVVRSARGIIVINPAARATVIKDYKVSPSNLWVLPHPRLLSITPPAKMNEQPARILFFGNIAKQKGVDSLIKAFADVHQKMPESQLIIAGGYGDNTTYKAAVDALLLASPARSSITMVGRINDVDLISELRMCTLVTLPYIDQGIVHASGPLMLAMAAGKPVIASDTPVFHDEIRESQAGVLIAPGDTRALADKILNLLKDKPERSRLADNAKLHIANEHSDVVIREKLDRIYTCL